MNSCSLLSAISMATNPGSTIGWRKKSLRRLRQEEKQLLYVASPRASTSYISRGHRAKQDGNLAQPQQGSLLAAGWAGRSVALLKRRDLRPLLISSRCLPLPLCPAIHERNPREWTYRDACSRGQPSNLLHRLPPHWVTEALAERGRRRLRNCESRPIEDTGSRLARMQGIVLHALLERAAAGTSGDHPNWERLTDALLRQYGLTRTDAAAARSAILNGMHNAMGHEEGRWLLDGTRLRRGGPILDREFLEHRERGPYDRATPGPRLFRWRIAGRSRHRLSLDRRLQNGSAHRSSDRDTFSPHSRAVPQPVGVV